MPSFSFIIIISSSISIIMHEKTNYIQFQQHHTFKTIAIHIKQSSIKPKQNTTSNNIHKQQSNKTTHTAISLYFLFTILLFTYII